MRNHKIILAGGLAKRLLSRGHYICDLKPKREKQGESCYVFFADKWLQQDIDDIMNNKTVSDNEVLKERVYNLGITEKQYRANIFSSYLGAVENG